MVVVFVTAPTTIVTMQHIYWLTRKWRHDIWWRNSVLLMTELRHAISGTSEYRFWQPLEVGFFYQTYLDFWFLFLTNRRDETADSVLYKCFMGPTVTRWYVNKNKYLYIMSWWLLTLTHKKHTVYMSCKEFIARFKKAMLYMGTTTGTALQWYVTWSLELLLSPT